MKQQKLGPTKLESWVWDNANDSYRGELPAEHQQFWRENQGKTTRALIHTHVISSKPKTTLNITICVLMKLETLEFTMRFAEL